MPGIEGCIETLSREFVGGWVVDAADPGQSVTVELLLDGIAVARAVADGARPDLAKYHPDRPHFGFALPLPEGLMVDQERIAVRVAGTRALLDRWEGAPAFEGRVERVTDRTIDGWAWRIGYPRERVALVVKHGGNVIGRVRADRFRHDLLDAGVGDGNSSFRFELEGSGLARLDPEAIDLILEQTGEELPWIQPRSRSSAPSAPAPQPVSAPQPAAAPPPRPTSVESAPKPPVRTLSAEEIEALRGAISFDEEPII